MNQLARPKLLRQLTIAVIFIVPHVAHAEIGLQVTSLGKLSPGLSAHGETFGTEKKWAKVHELLGEQAERVVIKQLGGSLGGNTSVRNEWPLVWKNEGYFRRARDLGQVFTAPHDFTLDSIVLRTGNADLAFLPGAVGAEVFVQFFEVTGTPAVNDNGTPPGTKATHGFSTNHRCDDFVTGVQYVPLRVITGGRLPNLVARGDGRLTYMKWSFVGEEPLRFEHGKRYAFMVGFVEPGQDRNFRLSNRNNAASPRAPAITDAEDGYHGGWGLRREGNGKTPPRMIPGEQPPDEPNALRQLKAESTFPEGDARYAVPPTCEGYPDVDTYRDLEFYIVERKLNRPNVLFTPRKYFDLYPLDRLSLPDPGSRKNVPPVALTNREPNYGVPDQMLHFLQGYLATVTFVDAQVGRLLDELDRLGLTNDTIVVLFGDHGFHLGEHGLWHKHTLFEEACRTPLIIVAPGMAADKRCSRTVELLDLFPTLADLSTVQPPAGLQGTSLRPLLEDPNTDWDHPACTVRRSNWNGRPITGRTIRIEHWRYTEWDGGHEGRELYDHTADPGEQRNLAEDHQYESVVRELSKRLAEEVIR